MWTIICNFWNLFPFSHYVDYHYQILEFLSLLPKRGLSFSKSWTIILNFKNFCPFSKNMDYHIHVLEFLSFLEKCGLSFASIGISFPSPKTGTIICNF